MDYDTAMAEFSKHLTRNADGTFTFDNVAIPAIDPVFYDQLKRSLAITNQKILSGEIDPKDIHFP